MLQKRIQKRASLQTLGPSYFVRAFNIFGVILIGNLKLIFFPFGLTGLKNCHREDGAMEQAAKQINDIISQPDAEKSFLDLIQTLNSNTGSMTSGQMIIMAMNSLLENVDNALKATNFEQDHLIQGNID